MSRTRRGPPLLRLCMMLAFVGAIAGCSDAPEFRETTDTAIGRDVSSEDSGPGVDSDVVDHADTGDFVDVIDVPDGGLRSGFQLQGQLVPTGGLSMSDGFTLSGYLNPGMPGRASSSENFSLTISTAYSQTSP